VAEKEGRLFSVKGIPLAKRPEDGGVLPEFLEVKTDGAGYVATEALADAVDAALLTGLPLLLTGEPGTGKTQLATAIAHQLDLPLLPYSTKSTATARDLLYTFDVVGRFYDAEASRLGVPMTKGSEGPRNPAEPADYVTFGALGAAIYLASETPLSHYRNGLKPYSDVRAVSQPTRCVVLIDEVDKAPRDFPNDLLNELDRMSFFVQETGETIPASRRIRPIVVLTSNGERELPEPFLRRCAYFHIDSFDRLDSKTRKENLERIIRQRLGVGTDLTDAALDHYIELRNLGGWEKTPSIAELLLWLRLVARRQLTVGDFSPVNKSGVNEQVRKTYTVLFKTHTDLNRAQAL
jgi:MoxR-like ATPase